MIKKHLIIALSLGVTTLTGLLTAPAYAEKPLKMNLREHMDPKIRNKLSKARLQGMLAGEKAKSEIIEVSPGGNSGCSIQIGENVPNEISNVNSDKIIIVETVINYCTR